MRVCLYAPASNVHTIKWCKGLISRGHKVYLISQQDCQSPNIDGLEYINPFISRTTRKVSVVHKILAILYAGQVMGKLNCDLYHMHWLASSWITRNIWAKTNKPKILSVWGQEVVADKKENFLRSNAKRKALDIFNVVTATSHYLRGVTKNYCKVGKRIDVVPFGVDTNLFKPCNPMVKKGPVVGFVKHLYPKYGPHLLIEAMREVVGTVHNAQLVIAGRGPLEDELKNLVKKYKLTNNVSFLGFIPNTELPKVINTFSVVAMPSVYDSETFGVSALEASSCEVPVVATWVGGVPEAVINNKTGFTIPPNDSLALAEKVTFLLKNQDLSVAMGKLGRQYVINNYRWEDCVTRMDEIYNEFA